MKVISATKNIRWELKLCKQSILPYFLLIKSTLESEIIYVFKLFVTPINTLLKHTHMVSGPKSFKSWNYFFFWDH